MEETKEETKKMSNSLVQFGSWSEDAFTADNAAVDATSSGLIDKIEVGENVFRILPPSLSCGRNSPFRITAMHFIKGVPGTDKQLVFACPKTELKEPCPACQEADRLARSQAKADRERAFEISAGLRVYACVINRAKPEAGVRVISFGKQIYDQLKTIRKSPRLGGDFTNPFANGFDIIINREGTSQNDTKYKVAADRQASALAATDAEMQEIIDSQPNLEQFIDTNVPDELYVLFREPPVRATPANAQVRPPAQSPQARIGAQLMAPKVATTAPEQVAFAGQSAAPASVIADAEFDDDFGAP
jgi:hypothetical protein